MRSTRFAQTLQAWLHRDPESRDLLRSTARSLLLTITGLYAAWHMFATLAWPHLFSPSLWGVTVLMLATTAVTLRWLERRYMLSQAAWITGLAACIWLAYALYGRPEISLLLATLPLIAIVTMGAAGALGALLLSLLLSAGRMLGGWLLPIPELPASYALAASFSSVFSAAFGWGLANNLLSALSSSSYHYRTARRLLEETRQHRAQISRMLKEQSQANYQLERLNQALEHARQRAEDARQDRDHFILAVSHELRSPLNFILGFSDLMVNAPETYAPRSDWPAGLYEDAEEIYRSSTHLLGLINDILAMGQADARQMTIFRERTDLVSVVHEVCALIEPAFSRKGLYLRVAAAAELPEVFADVTRLRQVLLNLLNNSLRFTDQGGVAVRLELAGDNVQVAVEDSGAGIAPEEQAKVFDEFRQVGVDRWRRREGTGLGLSISRRFVELHGGRMWLESALGKGTTFYFTIPLHPDAGDTSPEAVLPVQPPAHGTAGERAASSNRRLALLVSDRPQALNLVQRCLDDWLIVACRSARQLPELVASNYPRLVLVDPASADLNSLPLGALPYSLPVISLPLVDGDEAASMPASVRRFLVKPVSRRVLAETISGLQCDSGELLLVDDDPAMLRFIAQALSVDGLLAGNSSGQAEGEESVVSGRAAAGGFQLATASSGEEALRRMRLSPPRAVLLDLDLPDLNGWQVLEAMSQDPALYSLPVVILSAMDQPVSPPAATPLRLEAILGRRISNEELQDLLRALVQALPPPELPG